MWLEDRKSNPTFANRDVTGESKEEVLLDRCIEGSAIFLIWSHRLIMMNSVFEGLRQRSLDDIH